jgi:hypothetical protein
VGPASDHYPPTALYLIVGITRVLLSLQYRLGKGREGELGSQKVAPAKSDEPSSSKPVVVQPGSLRKQGGGHRPGPARSDWSARGRAATRPHHVPSRALQEATASPGVTSAPFPGSHQLLELVSCCRARRASWTAEDTRGSQRARPLLHPCYEQPGT